MYFFELGFIIRPKYLDMFLPLPDALRVVIGQLRVPSNQILIENGRANNVPWEERICRLWHLEIEDEYCFTCKCPTYVKIRETYKKTYLDPPLPHSPNYQIPQR